MKLDTFCNAKDIVNKTNWHPTDWEQNLTNSTSDRGLIYKIYKELKKITSKKKKNQKNTKKNGV